MFHSIETLMFHSIGIFVYYQWFMGLFLGFSVILSIFLKSFVLLVKQPSSLLN